MGLDVHDAGLAHEPLEAGMVITIEPGVYIPDERLGVRIAVRCARPGALDEWTELHTSPKPKRFRDERE